MQLTSEGLQKRPLAAQLLPLTTLCPELAQVHRTVSPAWMVSVDGLNMREPDGPTVTVQVIVRSGMPASAGVDRSCGGVMHTPFTHIALTGQSCPQEPQL